MAGCVLAARVAERGCIPRRAISFGLRSSRPDPTWNGPGTPTVVWDGSPSVTKPPTSIKGSVDLETGGHNYPGDDYIDQRMKEAWDVAIQVARKMNCKYSTTFPKTFKGTGGLHTNGTCRAGSSPKNSVIDQNFESHDVKGLFIAHASSYPRAVSCNSGLATATMGVFAAQRIVRNHFTRG